MKYLTLAIAVSLLMVNSSYAKPNKCNKYKKKLDNIQSQQRQPNTVKKSNKLKAKELKTFKLWRKCKQGKLK